jgi:membrane associated rhomboid family serine protease
MNLFDGNNNNTNNNDTMGTSSSLTTRFKIWFNGIPMFTRFILIICIFLWLIRALFNWPQSGSICFHYESIKYGEFYRLFSFVFFHQDLLHILFNMMGLLSLCIFLEHKLGTTYMLCCTILLIIFTAATEMTFNLILIDVFKLNTVTSDSFFSVRSECAIGFSGILFAYMILSVHHSPVTRSLFGVYSVSARVYPWILLLLSSIIMPGVSFLGHLSGIIAGYMFITIIHGTSAFNRVVNLIENTIIPNIVSQQPSYFTSETAASYTALPYDGQQMEQAGAVPLALASISSWIKSSIVGTARSSSSADQNTDPWANKGQGRILGHN